MSGNKAQSSQSDSPNSKTNVWDGFTIVSSRKRKTLPDGRLTQKKVAFTNEESVGNVAVVVTDVTLPCLPGMDPVPTANKFTLLAGEDIDQRLPYRDRFTCYRSR